MTLRTQDISERPARLTGEQRREILEAYVAGKSGGFIARKYGICASYPRHLAHKAGFKRDYSWHDEVRQAAASGVRISTLARRYDKTVQRISQIVRAAA